ncbi:MAG: hypothetical protein QNJ85_09450 [Gammaproteobacteria bacterium]|nr:hypothetical protein [Gammaproteobacteria bacterium]
MRKIRNNVIDTANPSLLFARGVESIIRDPMISPSSHDADEAREMIHRASKESTRGNLFNSLLRQFANL